MTVASERPMPRAAPVDPRIERTREAVLGAAIELLGEVGYGPLAIEAVAARSGVAKSTIYRHWPGKEELAAAAFARLRDDADAAPPPGPARERVTAILRNLALKCLDPDWDAAACMPAAIEGGARSAELASECARTAEERARQLVDVLQAGIDAGEIDATVDASILADSLVAPILLRRLFYRELLPPDAVPALVAQVLGERRSAPGGRVSDRRGR